MKEGKMDEWEMNEGLYDKWGMELIGAAIIIYLGVFILALLWPFIKIKNFFVRPCR